jgi:hypothetical protein
MFLFAQAHADDCSSGTFNSQKAEQMVAGSVMLINEIIRNPKAASMRNWERLSNAHDETEIGFFANSISDGTDTVYTTGTPLEKRIERHSRSQTDQAVVLQYLRLSLLAFSSRPGKTPPNIVVSEIFRREGGNEIVARGRLDTYGSDGKPAQRPIEIGFDIEARTASSGDKDAFCLSLDSIMIGKQKVFGWWHDL